MTKTAVSTMWKLFTGPGPFPFLSLPREIRDEIYTHLLIVDSEPLPLESAEAFGKPAHAYSPFGEWRRRVQPIFEDFPKVDLSIFRVSRQIHEEASAIFYGKNIFPIRVLVDGGHVSRGPTIYDYYIRGRYMAPWEDLIYSNSELEPVGKFGLEIGRLAIEPGGSTDNQPRQVDIYLGQRYRHNIRHIRLEVIDIDFVRYSSGPPHPGTNLTQSNLDIRTQFMPLALRLRPLLVDRTNELRIDIRITSSTLDSLCDSDPTVWANIAGLNPLPSGAASIYQQMIRLVGPFLWLPAKIKIWTPLEASPGFSGLQRHTQDVIEDCIRTINDPTNAEHVFRQVELRQGCFFRRIKGVLKTSFTEPARDPPPIRRG
ncbi:hypothetical protein TWF970_004914 [Orbilia oligospora]|uniref:F-box domain-containing protein n=1 Tax=Orbilia oligospora TaxID=2813651 RepID=A0A7C8R768_ORBOL|nr:hypothetical protein TWF970_004914 [Orbilia oligospora]